MKASNALTHKNFWIIVINSTSGFVLAYLFIFYMNHMATIFSAGMFNYDLSFNYCLIYYHLEPYEWTADAVKLIYSSGPVLIFLFGFIALIGYYSLHEEQAPVKIFFLWFVLLAFNYVFGGLMIGNIFKKGVGHVFNWMYFTDTQKLIVALIGFFGLLSTGLLMAKPVAHSANSYFQKLDQNNFPFFFTAQIIVPFILGTILIITYFYPTVLFQERYGWISLGALLTLTFLRANQYEKILFDEEKRHVRVSYVLLLLAVFGGVGLRILLSRLYLIVW
ncbi:MAG TPA: hypothetical protein ENH02_02985 [Bacteroidetes bacterium]|nr:hypothetical protein [Bacteroidota bacterium]